MRACSSLAMSVVGIFGTFANYKMGTYQISDIRRENTVGEYMGFRCFTLAGAFVACMIYAALTCAPEALITVALFYAFKGVGLVIDILHGVDQINRRMDYIGKSFILQGTSTLVAFVVVYWATRNLDEAIVAMLVAGGGRALRLRPAALPALRARAHLAFPARRRSSS